MKVYILTRWFEYEGDDFCGCTTDEKIVKWWCENIERGSFMDFEVEDFLDFKNPYFISFYAKNTKKSKIRKFSEAKKAGIEVRNIPERYKEKFAEMLKED